MTVGIMRRTIIFQEGASLKRAAVPLRSWIPVCVRPNFSFFSWKKEWLKSVAWKKSFLFWSLQSLWTQYSWSIREVCDYVASFKWQHSCRVSMSQDSRVFGQCQFLRKGENVIDQYFGTWKVKSSIIFWYFRTKLLFKCTICENAF